MFVMCITTIHNTFKKLIKMERNDEKFLERQMIDKKI